MTQSRDHFFITHTRTIVALLFGLSFSVVVAYATPPGSAYTPGETLDPTCAPGDTNCTVSVGAALTFSTGLTNTANTITNNLSTGVSGGQSVVGGTAASNNLTLSSTADATKGKIIFGTSAYDEVNNRLGIGTVSPDQAFVVQGADVSSEPTFMRFDSGVLTLEGDTSGVNGVPIIDFKDSFTDQVLSRMGYVNNRGIVISNYRSGLGNEAIFFEHSADEHSLVVVYGVSAYGIQTRVGIGTDTPSSRFDVVSNNLGTTQTTASGIALSNTHTAVDGLQQMSPALRWSGHGWKTDAVAESQDVEFRAFVTPVQGTANPTGYLGFGSSINGGAYNDNQLVLTSAGYVGIGTTSPGYSLDVAGAGRFSGDIITSDVNGNVVIGGSTSGYVDIYGTEGRKMLIGNGTTGLARIDLYNSNNLVINGGNVGIANTAPGYLLHTGSSSVTTGTTVARFENAGGTCDIVPSTAGGITCTSDERLKKNVTTLEDTVLDKVISVRLVDYNLITESENAPIHVGVIAQEFEQIFPDLVQTDSRGFKSVSYVGLIPYVTKAVQEMHIQMIGINDMETENTWRDSLVEWFGNITNGITRLFAGEIETKNLCVSDESGAKTCITKEQLDALLEDVSELPPPDPVPPEDPIEDPETEDTTDDTNEDTFETSDLPPADDAAVDVEIDETEPAPEPVVNDTQVEEPLSSL